jgi:transcriptional regulator with XRE-family HTH domain
MHEGGFFGSRTMTADRNAVDALIGSRIRLRRSVRGLSQEKLGDALGLSYQQVQKYERGQHRVSASRLAQIARILGVEISFFLDPDMAESEDDDRRLLQCRETLELIRVYHRIGDPALRKRVVDLIRSMGEASPSLT